MKRILIILLCIVWGKSSAMDYTPFSSPVCAPAASMRSVNNTAYMASGSALSPTIHMVGAYTPSAAHVRKAPPGTGGESGYDPGNPQFAPIGDAWIPLIVMILIYTLFLKGKSRNTTKNYH